MKIYVNPTVSKVAEDKKLQGYALNVFLDVASSLRRNGFLYEAVRDVESSELTEVDKEDVCAALDELHRRLKAEPNNSAVC